MGQSLKDQGYDRLRRDLDQHARERVALEREAGLDATQVALGAAGIIDPTGAADAASAAISLARGDYFGFVLDGASAAVPYVGDLIAKPIRGIQMGVRAWARGRRIAAFARRGAELVEQMVAMRKRAAEAVKRARRRACVYCNNAYGTRTPTRGTWADPADPGHGAYHHRGYDYRFNEGYPDFDHPDMAGYLYGDGPSRVGIEMTGNRRIDEELANSAAGFAKKPIGYSWHHGDDGTTMYLVSKEHHEALVPHTGGHDIAQDPIF